MTIFTSKLRVIPGGPGESRLTEEFLKDRVRVVQCRSWREVEQAGWEERLRYATDGQLWWCCGCYYRYYRNNHIILLWAL